ncbi:MAG: DegT/DnrJ/EryC1/StrS family aminotransferase, partial [Paraperlucidibaca sp.]
TNDEALWRRMWSYKDHGKSYEAVYERQHPPGFRWVHDSFGTNWRMMEIQAVIGRIQLKRMAAWTAARTANAEAILTAARACPALRVPEFSSESTHAHYKTYVFVKPECLAEGWSRDRIMSEINTAGVPCFSGSCSEVYLEKAFDDTGWRPAQRLPVAKMLGETSLMFLVHPTLTYTDVSNACTIIYKIMHKATQNAHTNGSMPT